jgi:hypothetical protein
MGSGALQAPCSNTTSYKSLSLPICSVLQHDLTASSVLRLKGVPSHGLNTIRLICTVMTRGRGDDNYAHVGSPTCHDKTKWALAILNMLQADRHPPCSRCWLSAPPASEHPRACHSLHPARHTCHNCKPRSPLMTQALCCAGSWLQALL